MTVHQSVECLARETEVLSQCRFVHHKSHMTWPGSNPGHRGGKPELYGTAILIGVSKKFVCTEHHKRTILLMVFGHEF
jgi:hypothetical protein